MSSDVQTLLFARPKWDEEQARTWAKEHGYIVGHPEHTTRFFRFRQYPPGPGRYRTIHFGGASSGIEAVLRWPSQALEEAAAVAGEFLEETEIRWTR